VTITFERVRPSSLIPNVLSGDYVTVSDLKESLSTSTRHQKNEAIVVSRLCHRCAAYSGDLLVSIIEKIWFEMIKYFRPLCYLIANTHIAP